MKYICQFDDCHKTFNRPSRLETHNRLHTGLRPYVCDINGCSKSYVSTTHLKRHKQSYDHSSKSGDRDIIRISNMSSNYDGARVDKPKKIRKNNFKCPEPGCDAVFNKLRKLTAHSAEHPNFSQPFVCNNDGCQKGFPTMSKLRKHLKVHEGYPCKVPGCDEIFDTWSLYRRHFSFNHKVKEYRCSICQKEFTRPSSVENHIKSHEGGREMLHCPHGDCSRKYVNDWSLRQHVLSYHEGQRFQCTYSGCLKMFVAKCSLDRHVQKCHLHMSYSVHNKVRTKSRKKKLLAQKLSGFDPKLANVEDFVVISDQDDLQTVADDIQASTGRFQTTMNDVQTILDYHQTTPTDGVRTTFDYHETIETDVHFITESGAVRKTTDNVQTRTNSPQLVPKNSLLKDVNTLPGLYFNESSLTQSDNQLTGQGVFQVMNSLVQTVSQKGVS